MIVSTISARESKRVLPPVKLHVLKLKDYAPSKEVSEERSTGQKQTEKLPAENAQGSSINKIAQAGISADRNMIARIGRGRIEKFLISNF
jgi:hypothetical protein